MISLRQIYINSIILGTFAIITSCGGGTSEAILKQQSGMLVREFIDPDPSYRTSHASTLEYTPEGLVAAWFGGSREGDPDVKIWLSRKEKESSTWSAPVMVASDTSHPCWNPVLYQIPAKKSLLLFYKVGPDPENWWGLVKESTDNGKTWGKAQKLPNHRLGKVFGPIRVKPVLLDNNRLLSGSSTEDKGWKVHFEWTPNFGKNWERSAAIRSGKIKAIQPTLLPFKNCRVQALCRRKSDRIAQVWSEDCGNTWGEMKLTSLPNPSAGIDAVRLEDDRHVLIYNHTVKTLLTLLNGGRGTLNLAITSDGIRWKAALVLEDDFNDEFSYPAIIKTPDGKLHMTYTWKRRKIRHVVVDPQKLNLRPIKSSKWPDQKVVISNSKPQ